MINLSLLLKYQKLIIIEQHKIKNGIIFIESASPLNIFTIYIL